MYLSAQVSKSLGRFIVPWTVNIHVVLSLRICCYCTTTNVSNDLINFPICTECKEEGQKPIKRPKLRIRTLINNNNLPPSLAKFSPGYRKQDINKC